MTSIYKFYEPNEQNLGVIRNKSIFFPSAKNWEEAGEYDFRYNEIKQGDIARMVKKGLQEEYCNDNKDKKERRFQKLEQYGVQKHFGQQSEFNTLSKILVEEAKSSKGILEREQCAKNFFYRATGIFSTTFDSNCLTDTTHWDTFANLGTGFAIELNLDILKELGIQRNDLKVDYYYCNKVKLVNKTPLLPFFYPNDNKKLLMRLKILMTLPNKFYSEKEFRILKVFPQEVGEKDIKRVEKIPEEAFTSITVGPYVNENFKNAIINIVNNSLPDCSINMVTDNHGYFHFVKLK